LLKSRNKLIYYQLRADSISPFLFESEDQEMEIKDFPKLIGIDEYAKLIGKSVSTIHEWKRQGKLIGGRHFLRIGRKL
jgi:hypothetical protein